MESARKGLPAPAEQAYPAMPDNDAGDLSFVVGSTVVHVLAGYGGNERVRPVEITVEIAFVRDIVETEPDGSVEFYPVTCNVHFDPATWREKDGIRFYGDSEVEAAVAYILRDRGFGHVRVGWSEQGMQEPMTGNMDIDTSIATVIWPEAVAAEVAKAKAEGRGPQYLPAA